MSAAEMAPSSQVGRRAGEGLVSAAEALPPVNPWHDTSHLDHIPTPRELAACPPADPAKLARHHANVASLVTQAAWQMPAPAPDVEPFTVHEMVQDRLDELEMIFEAGAEAAETDRRIGWPDNEPERWS